MNTFPLEFIHAVVANIVSTPELKTLRKVNKTLATSPCIPGSACQDSLGQHPAIREYTRIG